MKVIAPSYTVIDKLDSVQLLKKMEAAGRVCWKSEGNATDESYATFLTKILSRGHESVVEHVNISVRFICDRGITHNIVRHRIASYSMESTRYCNYSHNKFGNEVTFIRPYYWNTDSELYELWEKHMIIAEKTYLEMIELGATPEEARSVLPHSLKSEIVVTMNLRQWRNFFKQRAAKTAHPQIRELALPLLVEFREMLPIIFGDIIIDDEAEVLIKLNK
ncbi:MAG: FAD-dependent thymidylate synthase [Defluviitaleaceae bacterium]|nr:FAD-dependent thymidylate synthase [Defluviitaleaceae bacterium]